jgi:hypothetical protein
VSELSYNIDFLALKDPCQRRVDFKVAFVDGGCSVMIILVFVLWIRMFGPYCYCLGEAWRKGERFGR